MPSDERYRAWAMAPRPYQVVARRSEAPGELTLRLSPTRETADPIVPLATALPGQYWVLNTAAGVRVPAIGGHAAAGTLEMTTVRVPCGRPLGAVGDLIGVRGPFGTGWDLEIAAGRTLLFIAWESGLGLLRPVLNQVIASSARHPGLRVWAGGRSREGIPLQDDWARWAVHGAGITITSGADVVMAEAARQLTFDPAASVALLAGPLAMAYDTATALVRHGLPARRIQLATHGLIQCTTGKCGRCLLTGQAEKLFACRNGPVIGYDQLTGDDDDDDSC